MSQKCGRLPLAPPPAVVPVVGLDLAGLLLTAAPVVVPEAVPALAAAPDAVPKAALDLAAEAALGLVLLLLLLTGACTAGRSFAGG